MRYKVGDKIRFAEEKRAYTVRACDERFLVCTKPFNLRPKTVFYTIVDLEDGIRGEDGYVFSPYDYYYDEDCQAYLEELQKSAQARSVENINGTEIVIEPLYGAHISYRNRIELNIV